jgi:hypothetical protein
MSTQDTRTGIEDLREVFERFKREMSMRAPLPNSSLPSLLASRVVQAINEGVPILEGECSRRMLTMPRRENRQNRWTSASLVNALELDLNREGNAIIRWLLISYWVVLCNFDAVASNVEVLMASNLGELTWLVAGALWVQRESGQPTTYQLRTALIRARAHHPGFDTHLATVIAGPQDTAREAALIIERLLADPSATLPFCGVQ